VTPRPGLGTIRSIGLGLRLAVAGGRESLLRIGFAAVGVAVGVSMLLLAFTAQAALRSRADRVTWQDAAYAVAYANGYGGVESWPVPAAESADGALFLAVSDYYDGRPMLRAYAAALGADPPVPPGLDRLPGPGEVAASPAMRRLLESTPDDQLDDRFPGRVTMTIGDAGLAHDNDLVAIVGRTPDQLRDVRSVQEVRSFRGFRPTGYMIITAVQIALAMATELVLIPVVILIVMVTRVATAQRERRLASIRLAGATRVQTAIVAAADTGIAAAAGALLAWILYEIGRRILAATVVFQGGHFFLDDVAVQPELLALILIGTPILVVLVTIVLLRTVQASPLSVSRLGRRPSPSAWPLLLIGGGIGGQLALKPFRDRLADVADQVFALLTVVTILGLVLIGPWLCMVAGRGVVHMSRRLPGLLAARRIAADPRATFRAVAGVVLAATAVTYIGSTAGQLPEPERSEWNARPGVVLVYTGGVPAERVAPLLIGGAVAIHADPQRPAVARCQDLTQVIYVSCPFAPGEESRYAEPGPGADAQPIVDIYIPTDGTLAAENRVRTLAANLVPNAIINSVRDRSRQTVEADVLNFGRLVSIAGLFVLLVGAFGLVVGMVGGILERRRPFALLRASGVRLGELQTVVFLETAATMVFTSAVGMLLGLTLAYVPVVQGDAQWQWPEPQVFAFIGGGVLAAVVFSALALPLLNVATRHDAVRYE